MKILIFGSTGMLGQILVEYFGRSHDVMVHTHATCDLANTDTILSFILEKHPQIVINAAALVDIDNCETNKDYAFKVNSSAVAQMAFACNEISATLIQISTDHYYLNDGEKKHTEEEPVALVNYYAQTKFMGEVYALLTKKHLIIRTNIIGFRNKRDCPTFLEWAINNIELGSEIKLFQDYFASSIDTYHFSEILERMMSNNLVGIYNVGCKDVVSKACFVNLLSEALNKKLNNPIYSSVKEASGLIKRANSLGLSINKVEKALNVSMPDVSQVIRKIIEVYHATICKRQRN